MSVSSIARAEGLDHYWPESFLNRSDTRLEIHPSEVESIAPLFKDYPYEHQRKYSGMFTYYHEGRKGFEPTSEGQYEYRAASGLFILNIPTNRPRPDEVIDEINQYIAEPAQIHEVKSISRESLWRFLENADEIQEVVFTGPEGEQTVAENKGELIDYTEDTASSLSSGFIDRIKLRNRRSPDRNDDKEIFDNLEFDLRSHLIKRAKAKFVEPDSNEPIIVKYKRGSVEMPQASSNAREYVIQLFERDVIYPNFDKRNK